HSDETPAPASGPDDVTAALVDCYKRSLGGTRAQGSPAPLAALPYPTPPDSTDARPAGELTRRLVKALGLPPVVIDARLERLFPRPKLGEPFLPAMYPDTSILWYCPRES